MPGGSETNHFLVGGVHVGHDCPAISLGFLNHSVSALVIF